MVDGARDGDPLPLAAGQRQPRFADSRVVPERQALDELVGVGHPRRPQHAVEVGLVLAEGDVPGDRLVEQVVLLEHEADLPP